MLTPRGMRWALFLTKIYSRIVRPFSRRQDPPPSEKASQEIKDGFSALDHVLEEIIDRHPVAAIRIELIDQPLKW